MISNVQIIYYLENGSLQIKLCFTNRKSVRSGGIIPSYLGGFRLEPQPRSAMVTHF